MINTILIDFSLWKENKRLILLCFILANGKENKLLTLFCFISDELPADAGPGRQYRVEHVQVPPRRTDE
jgi:hypothetical protein